MSKYKLGTFSGKGVSDHVASGARSKGYYVGVTHTEKKLIELKRVVSSNRFSNWLMKQFVAENPDIFPKEVFVIYNGSYTKVNVYRYSLDGTVVVMVPKSSGKMGQKTYGASDVFLSKREARLWAAERVKRETNDVNYFKKLLRQSKKNISEIVEATK